MEGLYTELWAPSSACCAIIMPSVAHAAFHAEGRGGSVGISNCEIFGLHDYSIDYRALENFMQYPRPHIEGAVLRVQILGVTSRYPIRFWVQPTRKNNVRSA